MIIGSNKKSEQSINERIKSERKKRGMTQEQMAHRLHMKRSSYAHMEVAGHPTPERLMNIADILGVSVDYLVTGEYTLNDSVTTLSLNMDFKLTSQEMKMIKSFRRLPIDRANSFFDEVLKAAEGYSVNRTKNK